MHFLSLAQADPPAAGAAIGQVVVATTLVGGILGALAVAVWRHRAGHETVLGRAAALSGRIAGLPGWAALPSAIAAVSLLLALFGMYWDISLHIDQGRDAGPLANPWHRLFGQDVTLWGPTHLMMLGGAAMTLIGQAVLLREGLWERGRRRKGAANPPFVTLARRVALMAGLLLGLSIFQAEFDFGVPQFHIVFQPMLIALAAGFALVAARTWVGAGGALAAAMIFLAVRGAIAVIVGPIIGETTPLFPVYLGEALCVELVGLWVGRDRPLALGAGGGALAGTAGFASEFAWSGLVMPLPWTGGVMPEGLAFAALAGIAGGLLGGLLGAGL